MRRRALLSTFGATAAGGLAGCLGDSRSSPSGSQSGESGGESTSSGPVRCRGDPITAERTVTDEPGYGDDVEYFSANRTIRYVAAVSAGDPAKFDTIPFSEWASIEAAEAAQGRVRQVTRERAGTDEFGSAVGRPPEFSASNDLVVMLHITTSVEDGEVASTPSLPVSDLADAAPRSVEATVSLDGDAFSRTVPVFADHVERSVL